MSKKTPVRRKKMVATTDTLMLLKKGTDCKKVNAEHHCNIIAEGQLWKQEN